MSMFLAAAIKRDALTANGALSNSTSGSSLVDYFFRAGTYSARSQEDVNTDMAKIFGEDRSNALKLVFYNRLVTRSVKSLSGNVTDKTQKGQGRRDEFAKSLRWLEANYPDLLQDNLHLIPACGCWKDLWYDSAVTGYHNYVNSQWVYSLIKSAIRYKDQAALVAKYLPRIHTGQSLKTDRHRRMNAFARGLCNFMHWTEKDYRLFKSDPTKVAHKFQRQMCNNEWESLDFNTLPGKALFKLMSSKGKKGVNAFKRHNLEESYLEWIKTKPVAKFTGYVFELMKAVKTRKSLAEKYTYDAQFEGLLALARQDVSNELLKKGVLCAVDTSGSMSSSVDTNGTEAVDVSVSLGIYFSSLLTGFFKDTIVDFDCTSTLRKLTGTFTDRVDQCIKMSAMGSTNFQSVIDLIVRVRTENPEIPISEYPQVLLVVSDMQFNPSATGQYWYGNQRGNSSTNHETAVAKLKAVGLELEFIWWQVNGQYGNDTPVTNSDRGVSLVSGFDPTVVSTILGGEEKVVINTLTGKEEKVKLNPYEQMMNVLNQEVLNELVV